jgi:hypothetical protein
VNGASEHVNGAGETQAAGFDDAGEQRVAA